jgi:hypothetical protein
MSNVYLQSTNTQNKKQGSKKDKHAAKHDGDDNSLNSVPISNTKVILAHQCYKKRKCLNHVYYIGLHVHCKTICPNMDIVGDYIIVCLHIIFQSYL